jgi:DNA-binding protein HU-beta
MNKQDLINEVTTKTGLEKKNATLAVEKAFEIITEALASSEKVSIHGFGSFESRETSARNGLNPKLYKDLIEQGLDEESAKLQAAITISASKKPAFKPATALKNAVKQ